MSVLSLKNRNVVSSKGNTISKEDVLSIKLSKISSRNLPVNLDYYTTKETIEQGACVSLDQNIATSASSALMNTSCSGIAFKSALKGEKICIVTAGKVSSSDYNFTAPFGVPVWVTTSGIPSQTPPENGYMQIIGFTVNENCFFVKIQDKVIYSKVQYSDNIHIPVSKQMYQADGLLMHHNIPDGAIVLSDDKPTNTDYTVVVATFAQNVAANSWVVHIDGRDVANVQTLIRSGGSGFVKVRPLSIEITANTITAQFAQECSGLLTYCILQ